MYTIKAKPEDFIVQEKSNVKISEGRYSYFKLTKKNRNTLDVVKELAKILNVKEKEIGFAGSKDKHAVTEQLISILNVKKEKVLKTNIENASFEFVGHGDKPISLGDLEGNYFEIVISDYEGEITPTNFCENYFDEQRFSKNNAKIGKHLIKKEFKEACDLIDNEKINRFLQQHQSDFIGALKKVPLRLLRMYVNSYQSYLWNEVVTKILSEKNVLKEVNYSLGKFVFVKKREYLQIPLIGFGSKEHETSEIKTLMIKENIKYKDFIIKQIPQLTLEGELRDVFIDVKNFKIEGNKVSFFLPKGSYATMVVRKVVN